MLSILCSHLRPSKCPASLSTSIRVAGRWDAEGPMYRKSVSYTASPCGCCQHPIAPPSSYTRDAVLPQRLEARLAMEFKCVPHPQSPLSPKISSMAVSTPFRGRRRTGWFKSSMGRACSERCHCSSCWGIQQVQHISMKTVTPSGRLLGSQYLFQANIVTWKTIFEQFQLRLSMQARQQAWSLSFP